MTREEFQDSAMGMLQTIDLVEDIVKSLKAAAQDLRIQVTNAVQSVDDHHDACIGDCAAKLAVRIRRASDLISQTPDNWSPLLRPAKSGP